MKTTCNFNQQVWAKGQVMKRCERVSSIPIVQQTQWYEGSCIFQRLKRALVLNLSFSISQKNYLFWQADFHSHLKAGCVGMRPIKWV
jgi:hypothetical protein